MSSDSWGSGGEIRPAIIPTFIRDLKSVLDLYPDDGQILKEMIQNAEDAGATEVKILVDRRNFHQDVDPSTLEKNPHLQFFKGPSVCVYNNAEFTDGDWEGICMLRMSNKHQDSLKVGRFGLGFKSVFHLTDRLVILSGDYIMYMDPFRGKDEFSVTFKVAGRENQELKSILKSLDGVFGVGPETFRKEGGRFAGTLFWFPLRQTPSELSSTVYGDCNVESLLASFKAEASSLLLFLNNVVHVSLLSRDDNQEPEELFSVGLTASSLASIQHQRQDFVTAIKDGLPSNEVSCVTEIVMETMDYVTSSKKSQHWLVANFHSGQNQISKQLSLLCSDPQLSYRPYVGVAFPLSSVDSFQSQIFCFLPLPLDTRSPTSLPIHVHGYFALEPNRRHFKWPPADKMSDLSQLDAQPQWNHLLVTELMPKVYCKAVIRLQELTTSNPETFYSAWPDVRKVHDRWKPLLTPLYASFIQHKLFFSHVMNGTWVSLQEAVLQRFDSRFSNEVQAAVVKVYSLLEKKLIDLPDHVLASLEDNELLEKVKNVHPVEVSHLVPSCMPHLSRAEKLNLLHYLCSHSALLLHDQNLLPLADGTSFGMFEIKEGKKKKKTHSHDSVVYWCSEELVALFPGLEKEFCDFRVPSYVAEDLQQLAQSGISSLDCLSEKDERIPALLHKSLETRFGSDQPKTDGNDSWLRRTWQHLGKYDNLTTFKDVPLIPRKIPTSMDEWMLCPLTGVYVYQHADGLAPLSTCLASALTKLNITVLDEVPDYVLRPKLGNFVNVPSLYGILRAMQQINDGKFLRMDAINIFNLSATKEEKMALVHFLSSGVELENELRSFLQPLELFTNALTHEPASVTQVPYIGPEDLPPVSISTHFLLCEASERQAAKLLGASELTLLQLVTDIMHTLQSGSSQYSEDEVMHFMTFVLKNKTLMADVHLVSLAKEIQFVRTGSNKVQKAGDLYDPTSPLLRDLFHSEHTVLFPGPEFSQPGMLKKLKKLGLRGEENVKAEDLTAAATIVSSLWNTGQQESAEIMATGLFLYLKDYGSSVDSTALTTLSTIQCLRCIQDKDKPDDYPPSLPLKSSPTLVKPAEMTSLSCMMITASELPALAEGLPQIVVSNLQVITKPHPKDVLRHLKKVLQHFKQEEAPQYKFVLEKLFQFFASCDQRSWVVQKLQKRSCVLIESEEEFKFAKPGKVWIQRRQDDMKMKSYRFALPLELVSPQELKDVRDLLVECGSSLYQDETMLQGVLSEIQTKHCNSVSVHPEFESDFQLVKHILDVLKKSDRACDGNTLLPIISTDQPQALRFKAAKDCTISPGLPKQIGNAEEEFGIYFVHFDISSSTALSLGAKLMKDRALTGMEGLDYGYGQNENLTHRLRKLLKEAYTDGFSVPKELIQNADDALATKVSFLVDERENPDSRNNLIEDSMASLQGPALWVYNDAEFSDADFVNIVKMGSETKKEDTTKVGRFGLGFNTVYNLTEVPAFISRHQLAMFDPQEKYLGKGKGFSLDFTMPVNKVLLGTMPEQFEPFQGVFGCTLKTDTDIHYRGTLFRFPFRTADQAEKSKLKTDSYSEMKRREFLKMLLEKAGSLLMFTQSVTQVEVYHLPSHFSDPTTMKCLLTVNKDCVSAIVNPPRLHINNKTILQFMKDHWSKRNKDIKIKQRLTIEMNVTDYASNICGVEKKHITTRWQLAWASGIDKAAKMVYDYKQEGLVPLAAVAISLDENQLISLEDSPQGFYQSGHLFCFLPLPEEMVRFSLPVHINGTFALHSDRRGLMVQTEDDFVMQESLWNSNLFNDAVVRAYLLLLELVKKEASVDPDYCQYYDLWPTKGMPCLVDSFYQHLQSDQNKVFPVPKQDHWISFTQAYFLEPEFRESSCGELAFECLNMFWNGPGFLVDVPYDICKLLKELGLKGSFEAKVITELDFYRNVLFPNLHFMKPHQRDILVHNALMQNNEEMNQLIKNHPCIPCESSSELKKPEEVIHPSGQVAKLFLVSEGCFPQGSTKNVNSQDQQSLSKTDFSDHITLQHLSELGMITNELPWEKVLDRAKSVFQLNEDERTEEALVRAFCLIEYLSTPKPFGADIPFTSCPSEIKMALSEIPFLPVCPRPSDWLFGWAGNDSCETRLIAKPSELFSDSLKDLASDSMKLLDTAALKGSTGDLSEKMKDVLKGLGVLMDADHNSRELQVVAVDQILHVTECHKLNPEMNRENVQSVTITIYKYLTKCLKKAEEEDIKVDLHACLSERDVVWTGSNFVQPSCVAFTSRNDCSPYLYQMEKNLQPYKLLFESIGVKEYFESYDVLSVLKQIQEQSAGEVLTEDIINLVSRLAQSLAELVQPPEVQLPDYICVYLPDRQGVMQQTDHLCVDDCEWLKESDCMKFVNGKIAPDIAHLLGVKTKRNQDFDSLTETIPVESFGQKEKLTDRIGHLLRGYTFDSSLWKELLQNADDSGATEAKFIMDFRHLASNRVPENWEALQGPAVCFYNNKSFTKEDMQGIQNLGIGSKEQDAQKIGQFGVGFNAVFHITDVPSFWTKEGNERDVICVFDPNCHYVRNTKYNEPGIKFNNMERMKQEYPDFMAGYLGSAVDMSQPGTLFRFPLRTEQMAEVSEIKGEAVSKTIISELLDAFEKEMKSCLLFLNSLHRIGIYTVLEDGSLKLQSEAWRTIQDQSREQMSTFKASLQKAAESMTLETMNIKDIDSSEAVVVSDLKDSSGGSEQWLTVHRLGLTCPSEISFDLQNEWRKKHFRLLPCGGVSVRLQVAPESTQTSSPIQHQVFCSLPLPIFPNLPMHVNGHFALDHETRRNLWDCGQKTSDAKSEWNQLVALSVIVPSYITALHHVKEFLFPADERETNSDILNKKLSQYHDLFPKTNEPTLVIWKHFTQEVYKIMARKELSLFPVTYPDQHTLQWKPAVTNGGFPGYFTNLTEVFKDQTEVNRVVLSQGSSSMPGSRKTTDKSKAKTMAENLEKILKQVNMKILATPFRIYEEFKNSGVEDVQHVTSSSVLEFLKSSGQCVPDACSIDGLPREVKDTPLTTIANVQKIVQYVCKDPAFLTGLDGLPLCLRQSGKLHWFSTATPKPIVSEFGYLLPGSADEFLHATISKHFKITEETGSVLQQLDIPMLADRLQYSLSDPRLRAAEPFVFDENMFPCTSWCTYFWKFLQKQFRPATFHKKRSNSDPHKGKDKQQYAKLDDFSDTREEEIESVEKDIHQRAAEMLQPLQEWCLIPVKKTEKQDETAQREMLYPIMDIQKVVYLSESRDSSNGQLWTVLKTLPLPFLDQLDQTSIASQLVASINHPHALLKALVSCADSLSQSHVAGNIILSYFNNNLAMLVESSDNEEDLKTELRSLPVFPAIDGKLIPIKPSVPVICLRPSVPHHGLFHWSQQSDHLLLSAVDIPSDLIDYLGFEAVKDAEFYADHLLRSIHNLPHPAILPHMDFLRENYFKSVYDFKTMTEEQKKLCHQLKATAFIVVNESLHKASDFYSPHISVFQVMCTEENFPPKPFNSTEWKGFMTTAGMVCDITNDMFLSFAQAIEKEGIFEITKEISDKSKTLVNHMVLRKDLTESGLLLKLRSIRFLLPSSRIFSSSGEITSLGKELQKVAPLYCQRRLVSFEESSFQHNLYLVWSNSCFMDSYAEPRFLVHFSKEKKRRMVMSQLCLYEKPPKEKVLQHTRNLCNRLGGDEGPAIFASIPKETQLIKAMVELYKYLEANVKDHERDMLRKMKIICDVDNGQMLLPENVVVDLRLHERIQGHIEKAPDHFGHCFGFFKQIGVSQNVTANHYACALSWLKTQTGSKLLNVEELKVVKTAVEGLFRCLREGTEEQKNLSVQDLYLPTDQKILCKSTELILKDDFLGDRFQNAPETMHFFLGFEQLGIHVSVAENELKLLPEQYRVVLLSEVVLEVIPEEICSAAQDAEPSNHLVMKLLHPMVKQAVVRLVFHQYKRSNKQFTEDTAKQVLDKMKGVSVKEVPQLKTILSMNQTPEVGTELSKVSFTEKSGGNRKKAVVYMAADTTRNWSENQDTCEHSLALALEHVVCVQMDSYLLHRVLHAPSEAHALLDSERIPRCSFPNELDDAVFPSPGGFIPLSLHHHLNKSFSDFYKGEHVGFELRDPVIDSDNVDDDQINQKSTPVYIYGIILEEVPRLHAENASRLARRYIVDLGPDHGTQEAEDAKLYKFVRNPQTGTKSSALLQQDIQPEPPAESEKPLELKTVLAEIQSLLTEAWQLPDKKGRRRVVMRLLLHWHPDKNLGQKEPCTIVTQSILYYIQLLEKGQKLPANDDGMSAKASGNDAFFKRNTNFGSFFFTNVFARGNRHREYFDSEREGKQGSSEGPGSERPGGREYKEPNPQPGESGPWLRQGQADLRAARAAMATCEKGYNWVCYQCHQAVEKGLKAVLFSHDADGFDAQSHDLISLAKMVANGQVSALIGLVCQLETRIGPHSRMRYPDKMLSLQIPQEAYQKSDASFALDIASQVLDQVSSLLQD